MEKVKAKLVQLLEHKSGNGAKGDWQIQTALLETTEKYPRKLSVQYWNELADKIKSCPKGVEIEFSVRSESREYQGKWYTDIKAWKIELAGTSTQKTPDNEVNTVDSILNSEDEGLPF